MKQPDFTKMNSLEEINKALLAKRYGQAKVRSDDHDFGNGATFDDVIGVKITSEGHGDLASVALEEAFGCCGKAYMSDFHVDDSKIIPALLKSCEVIAKNHGYSYIGFIHKSTHQIVKEAKKLGYKTALSFKNKRSKNRLSEMYKIL